MRDEEGVGGGGVGTYIKICTRICMYLHLYIQVYMQGGEDG